MTYSAIRATRKPDVIWDHKNNPEPWHAWRNKQTKVFFFIYNHLLIQLVVNSIPIYSSGYQKIIQKWKVKLQYMKSRRIN